MTDELERIWREADVAYRGSVLAIASSNSGKPQKKKTRPEYNCYSITVTVTRSERSVRTGEMLHLALHF